MSVMPRLRGLILREAGTRFVVSQGFLAALGEHPALQEVSLGGLWMTMGMVREWVGRRWRKGTLQGSYRAVLHDNLHVAAPVV